MSSQFISEPLNKKSYETKDFACGVNELDRYLKEKSGQEIRKNVSAVYILHEKDSSNVIGYYTLSSYSIELKDLPEQVIKKLPKYHSIPAILLGRLAIDLSMQGKGLGEYLLMDALRRSYELNKKIGSFAVIIHAKDKKIKSFYEQYGFMHFSKKPLTLYIPITTIKQLVN